MKRVRIVLAKLSTIFSVFIISFVALSTSVRAETPPPYPDYIQKLVNAGAQVKYLGSDLGLQGWMTVKNGKRQYVYVTPNQEAYMVGVLLDRDGKMVTAQQIDRFVQENPAYLEAQIKEIMQKKKAESEVSQKVNPVPEQEKVVEAAPIVEPSYQLPVEQSPSEQLFAQIQRANWVEVGSSSAPVVYAFIDPECPHCHQFIADLRAAKAYEKSLIRTRLLPVGIMGKDSLYEAAKLIDSKDPQKAFFDHLDGDEFALAADESYSTQKVQENMEIMQEWDLDVTPFVVYRNTAGEVKIIRGRPKQLDDLFNDIK